mmetsp:Transcript_46677/g.106513  ORF Transcript_46677/g.106513 Transcript_46677/m.106513 type:complete len:299 (+) Transcript_46677:93-989(+)
MPRREQTVSVSAFLLTALLSHNFVSCSHAAPADEPQCRLGKEKCAALLGDGGWASAYDPGLYTSRCNIPRVELEAPLSADDFRAQFEHQAVILVGHPENSLARTLTTRAHLTRTYGSKKVWLASANTFSHAKIRATVREYIDERMSAQTIDTMANESWYLFGDDKEEVWDELFAAFTPPEFFRMQDRLEGFSPTLSFGIGASGTGVPFHIHGPGFSETLWGKKRWFLFKDGKKPRFSPDETTLNWLEREYYPMARGEKPGFDDLLECVLSPGEMLFFPSNWYHSTLNLGETVFMSTFT